MVSTLVEYPGCTAITRLASSTDWPRRPYVNYYPLECQKFEAFMEKSVPDDFRQTINNKLSATVNWAKSFHGIPQESIDKQAIYPYILAIERDLRSFIDDRLETPTLVGFFTVFFNIRVLLLQQLATIDPNVTDPINSRFVPVLQVSALRAADLVEQNYKLISGRRQAAISPISHKVEVVDTPSSSSNERVHIMQFNDAYVNKALGMEYHCRHHREWHPPPENLMNILQRVRDQIVKCTEENLANIYFDPLTSVQTWRGLTRQPLPTTEATTFLCVENIC